MANLMAFSLASDSLLWWIALPTIHQTKPVVLLGGHAVLYIAITRRQLPGLSSQLKHSIQPIMECKFFVIVHSAYYIQCMKLNPSRGVGARVSSDQTESPPELLVRRMSAMRRVLVVTPR